MRSVFGKQEKTACSEEADQHPGERLTPPSWLICMIHLSVGPSVLIEARQRRQKSLDTSNVAPSEERVHWRAL